MLGIPPLESVDYVLGGIFAGLFDISCYPNWSVINYVGKCYIKALFSAVGAILPFGESELAAYKARYQLSGILPLVAFRPAPRESERPINSPYYQQMT